MRTYLLGQTGEGLPLWAYEFRPQVVKFKLLILGGVHGDEAEGVVAAHSLLAQLQSQRQASPQEATHQEVQQKVQSTPQTKTQPLDHLHLHLVPVFNPYGVWSGQRTNAQGVDLNRNLPTPDWSPQSAKPKYHPGRAAGSEPENQALVQLLKSFQPQLVITMHSWKPMLNTNGPCHDVAQIIAQHTGYKIHDDIGYPTPGSLGTYCTQVLKIPCLTYEIERGLSFKRVVDEHVPALHKALEFLKKQVID